MCVLNKINSMFESLYNDAGVGNYFEEAIKFADTFEEFFIEGQGLDLIER